MGNYVKCLLEIQFRLGFIKNFVLIKHMHPIVSFFQLKLNHFYSVNTIICDHLNSISENWHSLCIPKSLFQILQIKNIVYRFLYSVQFSIDTLTLNCAYTINGILFFNRSKLYSEFIIVNKALFSKNLTKF